ncbi:hypothetical protein ACVWYN_001188 [Pedobacter sp. UYP24]
MIIIIYLFIYKAQLTAAIELCALIHLLAEFEYSEIFSDGIPISHR